MSSKSRSSRIQSVRDAVGDRSSSRFSPAETLVASSERLIEPPAEEGPAVTCTIRCTPYLVVIVIVQIMGALVLGLEGYAFQQDRKWNQLVDGKRAWPLSTLHHHQFFEGKTLNLLIGRDEALKGLLYRKSNLDKVFLTLMMLLLLASIVHLILVFLNKTQSHSIIEILVYFDSQLVLALAVLFNLKTSVLYVLMGLMSLSGASMIVHMLTNVYEKNYTKGAVLLMDSQVTFEVEGAESWKVVQLRMEEITLANILSLCAHVSKPRSVPIPAKIVYPCNEAEVKRGGQPLTVYICNRNRLTKTNTTEAYNVANLDAFGFCDNADVRTAVYSLSFILVGLCWLVPVLIALRHRFEECLPRERPLNRQ